MSYSAKIPFGSTGLTVSRMGIGPSYGIDEKGLLDAFDRGINYFYFGTLRTAAMAKAIHELAPGHRDELVVAVQSYARWGVVLEKSVHIALRKLKLDYADILILGKTDAQPSSGVHDIALRLKERGVVRFLAVSAHKRSMFREHIRSGMFDVIMARYNAAHPGAETEVFPYLPSENKPGVIAFTATRWGTLLQGVPGEPTPTASDCYRFVLRHTAVDICLCGPRNRQQLSEALRVLQLPPMTDEELAWMRRVGAAVHDRKHHNYLLRRLIFD